MARHGHASRAGRGASRTQEKREAGSQAGAVYILYRYVYMLYKG